MQVEIMKKLDVIEKENNIKILYAIESGSRGWGFASKDSDYDVRFIYIHPTDCIYPLKINNDISLYVDISDKLEMDTEIFIDINLQHYPLRDLKNVYSDMNNIVKDYSKLNHRNGKKDELHLNKHAMHLIRLLFTGTEILEGKGINTYRENERELFLDIRNGKYSYNQVFEMVDEYEKRFKSAANNSSLPEEPNYKRVEELMIEIYERILS